MAFNDAPYAWFGLGYDLTSSVIGLETITAGVAAIDEATVVAATDVITVSSAHYLEIGDKVQFTTTDTLPSGLAASTDYYVLTIPSTTTLTVSASSGGTVVDITDTGTGTHSIMRYPTLEEVTDVEANATDGDFRKVMYGICEKVANAWYRKDSDDRPAKMTVSRSTSTDETTGFQTKQYVFRFTTEVVSAEVVSE